MIIKSLINLGLTILPFFIWIGYSSREPKMALAVVFALTLGLLAIYNGQLKAFKNKWVLIFLGYMLLNFHFAPKPEIFLFGDNVSMFWVWKPMFIITTFALMLFTVSSIDFTAKDKSIIFNIMVWCGFIVAVYMGFQRLGIDQWFAPNNAKVIPECASVGLMGATLGNPAIASSFLTLIIPIALLLKRRGKALLMAIMVCLTGSQVAIGALIIGLLAISALKKKKNLVRITALAFIFTYIFAALCVQSPRIRSKVDDKERFAVWTQVAKDIKNPISENSLNRYPFTGYGLGSFRWLFSTKHNFIQKFGQAHNDYIELLFNTGIFGITIFLLAIGQLFKDNFILCRTDKETRYLMSSFICIAVCAGGLFVWQLGSHIYYTIVIVGLLQNKGGTK